MRFLITRIALPVLIALALVPAPRAGVTSPCALEPLTLPLFGGTPVAALATPAGPAGTPDVDAESIRHALEQYVACTNTGEPTLAWAIFSPGWFARAFADPTVHYLPAFEQMLALPATFPGTPLELESVGEIMPRPDGRVAVTATFRSGDDLWTDRLVLVLVEGTWLIDDVE